MPESHDHDTTGNRRQPLARVHVLLVDRHILAQWANGARLRQVERLQAIVGRQQALQP